MIVLLLAGLPLLAAPPGAPKHWMTRDFQVYCGKPGSDRLADYGGQAIGPDLASKLAEPSRFKPLGCVPSATREKAVLAELGLLVDHFDRWGITPNLPVFGEGVDRYHRLYVRDVGAVASVMGPSAAEIPLVEAALSINAHPQKVLGNGASRDGVRYILAHELTHAMQRSSRLYRTSPAASVDSDEAAWITEGMADAVGLDWLARRARGAIRPSGMTLVDTPVGIRPYNAPLPITATRFATTRHGARAARMALHDYRTSSFWRFVLERLGGGDPAFFAKMLSQPAPKWPDGKGTHWIAWLDQSLRRQSRRSLSSTYGAFLPEFLSWGYSRFAGWGFRGSKATLAAYSPDSWLTQGFGGCKTVLLSPGATSSVELKLAAMSGACVAVVVQAPGFPAVGVDIIASGQPAPIIEGLTLGLGHAVGRTPWNCYRMVQRGAISDCRIPERALVAAKGKSRRAWTLQPYRTNRKGNALLLMTLASFPEKTDVKWLDRTDTIRLEFGLRAVKLSANTPTTRPDQQALAGPLSGALTGLASRGVRPGLPVAAAPGGGGPLGWFSAMVGNPSALGTTGLTPAQVAELPAGLPGLAVYAWREGEPTPDQVHSVVFEQPLPLGFEGRALAGISANLDPSAAPPRMGWPAGQAPVPVDVSFTGDRLAMRFETPLCIADLEGLGRTADPSKLADGLCSEKGHLAADISLPFGAYYVVGDAPPLDPDAVRAPDADPPDGAGGEKPADAAPTDGPDPVAGGGSGGVGAAGLCACTCERLARHLAEMQAVTREAEEAMARLSPEDLQRLAEAGEDPLPPALKARMQALDAFGPCLDACTEVFARCD